MRRGPPPALSRRKGGNQTTARPKIWVFSEGQSTEPAYLRSFSAEHGNARVDVIVEAVGGPMTVVRAGAAKRRELRRSLLSEKDQVWAAFDRDDHPRLDEAFELARIHDVRIAFSNPCFELWALLHIDDLTRAVSSADAQRLLRSVMPKYDHSAGAEIDYTQIAPNFETAYERASRMEERRIREGDDRGCPYTSMHKLAAAIIAFGDPDRVLARKKGEAIMSRHGQKHRGKP